LCDAVEADYSAIRGIANQKDFAAAALKTRCSALLFAMRAKKCDSVREFFCHRDAGQRGTGGRSGPVRG
jgi:hypothetical protein